MRRMRVNTFHQPLALSEALQLLAESTETTALLAGGTDLIVEKNKRAAKFDELIALSHIAELKGIEQQGDKVVIGAGTTHTDIVESPLLQELYPGFTKAVESIGTLQIRNLGTLGGNICNASPVADSVCPLITLGATLVLESVEGKRELPIGGFFLRPGQSLKNPNEILTKIIVPVPSKQLRQGFEKLGPRKAADIALINVAVALEVDGDTIVDAKIAYGSVVPAAKRGGNAEATLVGKKVDGIDYEALADGVCADLKPKSDRGDRSSGKRGFSRAYRRDMAEVLVEDIVRELVR